METLKQMANEVLNGLCVVLEAVEKPMKRAYLASDRPFAAALFFFFPSLKKRRGTTHYQEIITLPNVISLTRIPLGILVRVYRNHPLAGAPGILFILAMLSDHLDGTLARILGPSYWGAILDALCDKFFFFGCAWAFSERVDRKALIALLIIEGFITLAQLTAIAISLAKKELLTEDDVKSNIYGKWKFFLECLAFTASYLAAGPAPLVLMWIAAVCAALSIWKKAVEMLMKGIE